MNNFNDIIKQKVEQFEVPYNDAHWAEMEGKLNSIRTTKIRKNILSGAGAIVVLAVSSYFIFTANNDANIKKANKSVTIENTTETIVKDDSNITITESVSTKD